MIRLLMRKLTFLLLFNILLCSTVWVSAQEFVLPTSVLDGQRVFVEKGCVRCHSIMGKGGRVATDLAKVDAGRSAAGIVAMMWNHVSDMKRAMEVWQTIPKLDEQELANLVAYLFSISYFDEPGDPLRGRAVFQKNRCQRCHETGGTGGAIGPSLDKVKQFGSPLYLAQAMWNHGVNMSRAMERLGLKRPSFEGSDIADLLSYLRSISHSTSENISYMIPGSPSNGERLFRSKKCITCHAVGMKGSAKGPNLLQKEFHRGATAIAGSIWNHGDMMWKRMEDLNIVPPKLEGNEMADLISYLYFLGFQQQTGNPEHGKDLAETKGCTNCHTTEQQDDTVSAKLNESHKFMSFITIAARMWNHNLDMQERMMESGIPFPRFTEHEMVDLLAFIRLGRKWQIQ